MGRRRRTAADSSLVGASFYKDESEQRRVCQFRRHLSQSRRRGYL